MTSDGKLINAGLQCITYTFYNEKNLFIEVINDHFELTESNRNELTDSNRLFIVHT